MPRVRPVADRFWEKVKRVEGDGCWEWQASICMTYGQFDWRFEPKAHRMAWVLTYGPIPLGLDVLHQCDNRICVRPSHLFLGTQADNAADMVAKGRSCRGTAVNLAKLNEAIVRHIRSVYDGREYSYRSLGRKYGVSFRSIAAIVKGETWRHVA